MYFLKERKHTIRERILTVGVEQLMRTKNLGKDISGRGGILISRGMTLLAGAVHFWKGQDTSGSSSTLLAGAGHFWQGQDTSGRGSTLLAGAGHFWHGRH
jgi:hypothetical protein